MKVAVDISLYPLADEWLDPIKDVIDRLHRYQELAVTTNPMSTQVHGEYPEVMRALTKEMEHTFRAVPKAVFALRILNDPLPTDE